MQLHEGIIGLVSPFISCKSGRASLKTAICRIGTACRTGIAPLLLLLVRPAVAQAQFNYKNVGGTITITKYTGICGGLGGGEEVGLS